MSVSSFRFRLERVRALRERGEDAAKQELAGALMRHRDCEEQLEHADAVLAGARAAHLGGSCTAMSAHDLQARQAYLEQSERHRISRQQELAQREQELADRREALSLAARERQTLERLKEQRQAEHARETSRQEGLLLDELAINNFRRRAA